MQSSVQITKRSLALLLLTVSACGVPLDDDPSLGQVTRALKTTRNECVDTEAFDGDQSQDVDQGFLHQNLEPVGLLEAPGSDPLFCTATMVTDDLAITGGHCMPQGTADSLTFRYKANEDLDGYWLGREYPVEDVLLLEHTETEGDWAVIRVGDHPQSGEAPGQVHGTVRLWSHHPDVLEWTIKVGHPELYAPWDCPLSCADCCDLAGIRHLQKVALGPILPGVFGAHFRQEVGVPRGTVGFSGGPQFLPDPDGEQGVNRSGRVWAFSPDYIGGDGGEEEVETIRGFEKRLQQLPASGWRNTLLSLIEPEQPTACLTSALPSSQRISLGSSVGLYGRTSPSGSGSYGFPGCPFTWVTEVTNVVGRAFIPAVRIENGSCPHTDISEAAYGYNSQTGEWERLSNRRTKVRGSCTSGASREYWGGDQMPQIQATSHPYTKVRVLARSAKGKFDLEDGPQLRAITAGVQTVDSTYSSCSPATPCAIGDGVCGSDDDCSSDSCRPSEVAPYGPASICTDPSCPNFNPQNPDWSPNCELSAGEGDCDDNADCGGVTTCRQNIGAAVGASSGLDLCDYPPEPGCYYNTCSTACPCGLGQGDCNNDSQCRSGLVCQHNVGPEFGDDGWVDICVLPGAFECSRDSDCPSGSQCMNGTYTCTSGSYGDACEEHDDCDYGSCCDGDENCEAGDTNCECHATCD